MKLASVSALTTTTKISHSGKLSQRLHNPRLFA